ncbi:hypothetical protein R50073_23570 [Maricurvus nonylphenolicus]|uniref:hypothetical protein n=1 Tax=Maricurvus nonylphenolicus TaxID=1008307 RepID=UPI0036F3DFB1
MAKTFGPVSIAALNLLASLSLSQAGFAGEGNETEQENGTLPDMELLIYLGGWEINDQEAEEPLYWYDMDTTDEQTDQQTSATEAGN